MKKIGIPSSIHVLMRVEPDLLADLVGVGAVSLGYFSRRLTEGKAYNFALSSFLGDRSVATYLAVVAQILQWEEDAQGLVTDPRWHKAVAAFSAAVAAYATLIQEDGHGNFTDTAHNAVVMPVLMYAVLSTVPVVLRTKSRDLQAAAVLSLASWLCFVIYDARTGRLKQPEFGRRHGLL